MLCPGTGFLAGAAAPRDGHPRWLFGADMGPSDESPRARSAPSGGRSAGGSHRLADAKLTRRRKWCPMAVRTVDFLPRLGDDCLPRRHSVGACLRGAGTGHAGRVHRAGDWLVREKNSINVAIKNFANLLSPPALFWLFGFGLISARAPRASWHVVVPFEGDSAFLAAFFLFQLGFIATATTLISGAVAERMRFGAYVVLMSLSRPLSIRCLVIGCGATPTLIGERGSDGWLKRLACRLRWIHVRAFGGRLGRARGDHHPGAEDRTFRAGCGALAGARPAADDCGVVVALDRLVRLHAVNLRLTSDVPR